MTSPKIRSPSAAKTYEDNEKSSKKTTKNGAKNNHRDEIFLLEIIVTSCWGCWRSWGGWGGCWRGLHPSDVHHQWDGGLEAVWPLLFCLECKDDFGAHRICFDRTIHIHPFICYLVKSFTIERASPTITWTKRTTWVPSVEKLFCRPW